MDHGWPEGEEVSFFFSPQKQGTEHVFYTVVSPFRNCCLCVHVFPLRGGCVPGAPFAFRSRYTRQFLYKGCMYPTICVLIFCSSCCVAGRDMPLHRVFTACRNVERVSWCGSCAGCERHDHDQH